MGADDTNEFNSRWVSKTVNELRQSCSHLARPVLEKMSREQLLLVAGELLERLDYADFEMARVHDLQRAFSLLFHADTDAALGASARISEVIADEMAFLDEAEDLPPPPADKPPAS